MPDFQRKGIMFAHRGMNWNAPVEKLPDGQIPWAKNVRVLEQGTISSAHGHTEAFPGHNLADQYLHTISRLNVLNPAFDPNLRRTYVMGGDEELFVYQDGPTLTNSALNPVSTPLAQFGAFSGNPLSIVDAQPAGAAVAWKYIGDSRQMVTVGYYPSDVAGLSMARALTVGLTPPIVTTGTIPNAGGNLTGDYQWIFAFRRVPTGARSNPSAATRYSIGAPGPTGPVSQPAITLSNESVTMTLPTAPPDPQTGNPDPNVVVDVYRFGGTVFRWALVGTGAGGSTFTDNKPDIELLAASSPPQVTDASTGLTRFNLFRPFVTQDIGHNGQASVSRLGNGAWVLTQVSGAAFNPNWLPGSTIYVFGTAFTIYQVQLTSLELSEDATFTLLEGQTYDWSTLAGTLTAGQALPHLWGPYGIGQSGSYLFACGDPNGLGTLYWTNGNDPDSTDIVNNIQVTSPSEKMQTGCVYDGQPYCWSTDRQFVIAPSLTVFGQFTTQEVAGAKGCWLEWSLSVQSNGFADQSVTWRGKDGIYDWSTSGGLQPLTNPLYAFFPHDNHPGIAPETIMPFIGVNSEHPESVGNLDDTQPKYHRTCWFQGMLFYDFVALTEDTSGANHNTYSTLVWDSVNVGGWVSLDQVFANTTQPVARGVEIGANDLLGHDADIPPSGVGVGPAGRGGNLKVTWGGRIYDYEGYVRGFESRVVTRAEDMGDSRAPKLWGDYWFDCTPWTLITLVPLVNFNLANITPNTIPAAAAPVERKNFVLDFFDWTVAGGKGLLNQTLGLDVRWIASDGQYTTTINQWQPSFVAKPEVLEFRATDRSDEGAVQAKYLMGMNMEANTNLDDLPVSPGFVLNVIVDGAIIAQLVVNHDGQTEHPYAFPPVAGYEFQVQMSYPQNVNWQLFKISWVFQVWPDAVARSYPFQDLGEAGAKYIRGIVLPMETGGVPGTVGLWADDGGGLRTYPNLTTPNLKKEGIVLPLAGPITAHEIQFSTLTAMRIWPTEAKVDFDPYPEDSTEVSSFTDCGYPGAKFMQGAIIPMDTGGQPVQLKITYDNCMTNSVTLPATTTQTGCKSAVAFSFSPCNNPPSDPFIAHVVQVQPQANARVWFSEIQWIFEPAPELADTWETQPTNHDLPGWHSLRDCYIAYQGGSGAPTLTITTEYGSLSYTLDAVSPDQYVRCYRVLDPQKAKWRSYRVESCGGLRLYKKDCEVRVKAWGSTGPYVSALPFGGPSRVDGARI